MFANLRKDKMSSEQEIEVGITHIFNSVLITGPARVVESLDGSLVDVLQYNEYLSDATKLESRLKELAESGLLISSLPEGWKDYEWSDERLPKYGSREVHYFS